MIVAIPVQILLQESFLSQNGDQNSAEYRCFTVDQNATKPLQEIHVFACKKYRYILDDYLHVYSRQRIKALFLVSRFNETTS